MKSILFYTSLTLGAIALFPFWMALYLYLAVKIGNDGDCQEPEFLALSEREKERA